MTGKYLSLSTVHVKPETYYSIETMMDLNGFPAYKKEEYGYFIWIFPKELMDPVPKDLGIVLDYARQHGCDLLILDSDGDIIEKLPVYSILWDEAEGWN